MIAGYTGSATEMQKSAALSDDPEQMYRYDLTRRWRYGDDWAVWVMLNPSTADADIDDPTIRRCIGFTKEWGFGGLAVINIFAYRATNPKDLKAVQDPFGPNNGYYRYHWLSRAKLVIAAWGAHKIDMEDVPVKVGQTCQAFNTPLRCLGVTKSGAPKHPLYIPSTQELRCFGCSHCFGGCK